MTFTFSVTAADWGRIAPELIIAGMVLLVMLLDLLLPARDPNSKERSTYVLPLVSLVGLLGALAATIVLFFVGDTRSAFNSMVGSDYGSLYAYVIILSASILGVMLSPDYLKRLNLVHQGEYYALLLAATIGMMLLAAATSFVTVFLGLEMLSLALYILCGFVAQRKSSQEAGMKYFLLSSFASAFLLYGIAFVYGATGNTSFSGVSQFLFQKVYVAHPVGLVAGNQPSLHGSTLLLIGMGLLTVGFAFKVSAIPFQAWTPDVYDGAPAPVTGFMSVGTKAAALIAFARVFDVVFHYTRGDWRPVVWAIAILTIVGGNILALAQNDVKRLLAYSSIAHAGYLLIGVVASGSDSVRDLGISAILFYLLCYAFLNLGAFGVIAVLERADNSGHSLNELRGLWYRQPRLAGLLAFFLLALAGFPPMAGFAAKYYMFYAALLSGYPELLIIGVLASILGMYYYLRVIAVMFMERPKEEVISQVSVTPTTGRRPSTRANRGTATALAVKPAPKVVIKAESASETIAKPGWMTWTALWIAVTGTLAMGTILPFWLVDLALRAAQMMAR